ncbi:unnamed protein product [Prunus armeniaca]|uniref:Uncharacterized protein n=1 Tax=Prunus armeniaca TaxID=36596 RepID=A0A6J5TN66_PRUAR|nr:unnamed protein product [Prunus armeniaca]
MDSDEVGVVDYEFIDNDSDNSNDVASHRYQVYVIGEEGILKELELAGYQYLGGPEDGGKKIDLKPGFLMEHDDNAYFSPFLLHRTLFIIGYYKIQLVLVILVYVNACVLNTLQINFVASALVTCIAVFSGGIQCLCDGRYGTLCVRENPGCLFIATNHDAVTHLIDAQEWQNQF